MIICHWFVLFILYSCFGWIYETIYCTIKGKKWENRGFLYGPLCPIYGAGSVAASALVQLLQMNNVNYKWWHIFLAGYFGSIVLEYVTHWALEKIFHAYWWDYSYMPFNIKGRVCLPYSIAFGGAAVLVSYVIYPFMTKITAWINPMTYEVLALVFMAILGMDIALTVSALSDFENYVINAEEVLNKNMESFVENVEEKYGQMSDQMSAKMPDERFKATKERLVGGMRLMNGFYKSAISRVKGFRPGRGEEGNIRERIRRFVKEFRRDKVE